MLTKITNVTAKPKTPQKKAEPAKPEAWLKMCQGKPVSDSDIQRAAKLNAQLVCGEGQKVSSYKLDVKPRNMCFEILVKDIICKQLYQSVPTIQTNVGEKQQRYLPDLEEPGRNLTDPKEPGAKRRPPVPAGSYRHPL